MIEEVLMKIGLTKGEIKVYLSLLELGASSTSKIIKKSSISGAKVYEVLDRLKSKGLASSTVRNGVMYFEAAPPAKILGYLEEKKEEIDKEKDEIQKIIPELILKQQQQKATEVKIYTGWEGMKTVNEHIISSLGKGEEWLSMGLTKQPESWEAYFSKKQIARAKKGIVLKHLLNEKYRSIYEKRKSIPYTEWRFLPKDLEMPTSTEIYHNSVVIFILLQEAPASIVIESKPVADGFRKYFSARWKSAKSSS